VRRRVVVIYWLLQCCLFNGVPAQDEVSLGAKRGCLECSIEVARVATLGDREGPGFVGYPSGLGRLSTGEWLLADDKSPAAIAVFDSNGAFRRRIGRLGSGPGEFRWITTLDIGRGDTIRIYDAGTARLTIMDGALSVVRTLPLGIKPPSDFAFMENGRFVAAVELLGVEHLGYPLHLMSEDGTIQESFGATDPAYRKDGDPRKNRRALTRGDDADVWSAPLMEYCVERWGTDDGRRIARSCRDVPWFPKHDHIGFNGTEPPNAYLLSIRKDDHGRLWTMVRIAGANWTRGVGKVTDPFGVERRGITDRNAYYDTILEVFDSTGALLASQRLPQALVRFTSQGFAVGYREDAQGYPFVDVYTMSLHQRR
jgi:hypothetical protein